jgi:hypothetical protein
VLLLHHKQKIKTQFMKRIMLLVIAAVITTVSFGQVRFGGQLTANLSSASVKGFEGSYTKSPRLGAGVGVVAEIALANSLSLRPSLNFLQKGVKLKAKGTTEFGGTYSGENTTTLSYIELPVTLAYNVRLTKGNLYFGAGPSFGYGVGGKVKSSFTTNIPGFPQQAQSESVSAFKKEADGGAGFKRFDVSANIIAGFQFDNGFFVNAGSLLGFSNLSEGDSKYKNTGFQLTAGFLLKAKK